MSTTKRKHARTSMRELSDAIHAAVLQYMDDSLERGDFEDGYNAACDAIRSALYACAYEMQSIGSLNSTKFREINQSINRLMDTYLPQAD